MIPDGVRHQILTALDFARQAVEQYQEYPTYEIRQQRLAEVAEARRWVIDHERDDQPLHPARPPQPDLAVASVTTERKTR